VLCVQDDEVDTYGVENQSSLQARHRVRRKPRSKLRTNPNGPGNRFTLRCKPQSIKSAQSPPLPLGAILTPAPKSGRSIEEAASFVE
jgi:hypothetical protein